VVVEPGHGRSWAGRSPSSRAARLAAARQRRPWRSEFRLAELLTPTARAAFPRLQPTASSAEHVLFGPVRDSSELHAVRSRIHLMGLTILDVHRLPD
jgi:hypothetical protein